MFTNFFTISFHMLRWIWDPRESIFRLQYFEKELLKRIQWWNFWLSICATSRTDISFRSPTKRYARNQYFDQTYVVTWLDFNVGGYNSFKLRRENQFYCFVGTCIYLHDGFSRNDCYITHKVRGCTKSWLLSVNVTCWYVSIDVCTLSTRLGLLT